MDFLQDFLVFALPSGFLSSVVTWFATRRKRNNDFLSELQQSIDLLAEKYTVTLDENIQLKADNAQLLANQQIMSQKIDFLTRTVEELKNQLKLYSNDKQNKGRPSRVPAHIVSPDSVRNDSEGDRPRSRGRKDNRVSGGRTGRISRFDRPGVPADDLSPGNGGFIGDSQGGGGDDTSGLNTTDDTDPEHS